MKTLALSQKLTFGVLALVGLAATTTVLTGGCHHDASNGSAVERREPTFAREQNAAQVIANGGRAAAPGLRHVYAMKLQQDLGFIAKKTDEYRPDQTSVKLAIRAEMHLAFVGSDGDRHRLYGQLANVVVDLGDRADTRPLAAEMERPFFVTTDADGRVRGYAFARGVSSIAQNMIRSIVGQGQIAAKADAKFEANEDDIHGSYVAAYERAPSGEIKKTKVRYERIATSNALVAPDRSARIEHGGQTIASLDQNGWPLSVVSDEKKVAAMGDDMPTATTQIHFEMKLTSTKADPALVGAFERERATLIETGPFGNVDEAAARRASDEKLAGDKSFADLLAGARRLEGEQARGELAERMAARFRLTPTSIDDAAATASSLSPADAKLLTSALASAGTAEGTRALGAIANDKRVDADVRAQAATQLAFSGKNAAEAKDALVQAMGDGSRDVRASAALALGSVVREIGGDTTVVTQLAHDYREATTDEERITFLHALGNTGSLEVLPIAREALTSPNEALRDAAAQALRFLPLGEADALLDAVILGDDSDNVREAAVEAVGQRIVERHAGVLERVLVAPGSNKVKGEIFTIVTRSLATRGATLSKEGRAVLQALLAKAQ